MMLGRRVQPGRWPSAGAGLADVPPGNSLRFPNLVNSFTFSAIAEEYINR
jgi:hypothetical protein